MAHAEALRKEAPESKIARQLGEDYRHADLTTKQVAMLEFAEFLTVSPSSMTQANVDALREAGWSDEDVIDIVHITALYAYQVRVAEGLGIEIEVTREEMSARLSFGDKVASKTFGSIAEYPGR